MQRSKAAATCLTRLRAVRPCCTVCVIQQDWCTAACCRLCRVALLALVAACVTERCHINTAAAPPLIDGAPFNWGASERFLAGCMRAEGGQGASGSLHPVVVSKYIPLPWRLLEPRCMLGALRSSGGWNSLLWTPHSFGFRRVGVAAVLVSSWCCCSASPSTLPIPLQSGPAWRGCSGCLLGALASGDLPLHQGVLVLLRAACCVLHAAAPLPRRQLHAAAPLPRPAAAHASNWLQPAHQPCTRSACQQTLACLPQSQPWRV